MAGDQIIPVIEIRNKDLDRARKGLPPETQEEKEKERNKKATAKKKAKKSGKGGSLAFLATTNDWLEDMPLRIIAAFENFVGSGENALQSKVDIICAWLAWKVNIAVERKRQAILRILYGQYEKTVGGRVMKVASAVQSFCNDPLGALGSFAGALFAPIAAVFNWILELGSQILRLAENLAKIVSALPPTPPNPRINYDKFKLKIGSISLSTITSDPYKLPPPEVMFPEPEKPFTKETFAKTFETATARLKSGQKKYMLSEEDRKTLAGFDAKSLSETLISETNPLEDIGFNIS